MATDAFPTGSNETAAESTASSWRRSWRALAVVAASGAYALILFATPVGPWLLGLLTSMADAGPTGYVAFVLAYAAGTVFFVPDGASNMAAGALWGIFLGGLASSIGRAFGASVTFWIARSIGSRWVAAAVARDPRYAIVAKAVERDGFRMVLLLRLCPVVPVNVLNYTLGLTTVRFSDYVFASLIGLVPRSLVFAYLGHAGATLATSESWGALGAPWLLWFGLVLTIGTAIALTQYARRVLRETAALEAEAA